MRGGRSYRGYLGEITPDSVRINAQTRWDGQWSLLGIPRDSIARVELIERGARHTVVGAALGLGVGATAGLIGAFVNCPVFCSPKDNDESGRIFKGSLLIGGVLGALIGWGERSESSSEVPLSPTAVTIVPTGKGVGFGLSLRF